MFVILISCELPELQPTPLCLHWKFKSLQWLLPILHGFKPDFSFMRPDWKHRGSLRHQGSKFPQESSLIKKKQTFFSAKTSPRGDYESQPIPIPENHLRIYVCGLQVGPHEPLGMIRSLSFAGYLWTLKSKWQRGSRLCNTELTLLLAL